uniref:hypothetical protein n=1 Tax=Streptomyces sp. NRRL F-2664 TaxID=1463842 RepID=UPI001F377711
MCVVTGVPPPASAPPLPSALAPPCPPLPAPPPLSTPLLLLSLPGAGLVVGRVSVRVARSPRLLYVYTVWDSTVPSLRVR